eukprot:2515988-Rhodomonas_salina.1
MLLSRLLPGTARSASARVLHPAGNVAPPHDTSGVQGPATDIRYRQQHQQHRSAMPDSGGWCPEHLSFRRQALLYASLDPTRRTILKSVCAAARQAQRQTDRAWPPPLLAQTQ